MAEITCETSNNSPVWDTWKTIIWKLPTRIGGGGRDYLLAFKDAWVSHNKTIIRNNAAQQRFPALLLAGVCWNEVAGDPQFIDGAAHAVRSFDWSGPDIVDRHLTITRRPARTSFGPVSMQLRTAAQTLGIDIATMDYAERAKLGACLEVDVFNIQLAARHLRELIDHDALQTAPPALGDEALEVAATRYNRGTGPTLEEIKQNLGYGKAITKRRERLRALLA